jgi:arylsulfate sulfotransferase
MKLRSLLPVLTLLTFGTHFAGASQADDTTITITGQTAGATPFISQLSLTASQTDVLKNIQFAITPKAGSVTRPLSGTYSNAYLTERGYLNSDTGEIFLPVYGLYADFSNTVTLTYHFYDGSSKQDSTTVATAAFDDPCGYDSPMVLQARTNSTALSYDYIMVKGACSKYSPAILDTDGAIRWVGPNLVQTYTSTFFDNAIYTANTGLTRVDLDGTITPLVSNSDLGVTYLHHNIDRGKTGIILDVDTADELETVNIEVDATGKIIKEWHLAQIISDAMIAGGDDPSQFVFPSPDDWFHNNAVAYNRADDSLVVSSREDFVICLDYETEAIKWILGDTTKLWYTFPSLAKYALTVTAGGLPPIGQHAPSITYDQGLLLFDNGTGGIFFTDMPGQNRLFAVPRKYQIDTQAMTATEVWNYPQDNSILSPFCGSVYEDAPLNYLVDYALVNGAGVPNSYLQLLGLDASGEKVFYYQYSTHLCDTGFNSIPLHLENTSFPTVMPQALNFSTRGVVGNAEDSLIGGFIVTGTATKTLALRALGPSLGLPGTVADPNLTVFDSTGAQVATNDNWQTDPNAGVLTANGLAPNDPAEAGIVQSLAPGAYTFVVTGKGSTGIGLVEAYDLSPLAGSKPANISTRGSIGSGDNVLIGGFLLGEVDSNTVVIRAIGPSLTSAGILNPLSDPTLTVYDSNGAALATNDNWQDDNSSLDIEKVGLAPTDPAESATILHLPAGAYTTIVSGANGAEGVGLVEVYDL